MLWVFLLEIWFRNLASLYIFKKETKKSPCFLSLTGQKEQVIRSINIEDQVEKMGLDLLPQN